ncbi:MAG: EVE domain-containing protein [Tropicimonas sp.]|uniref:EVE domain-containing protein n=1 Tax=Tropicimonas sp. TaxID=2067044 RepID=UPI003A8A2F39
MSRRNWIAVASAEHVLLGRALGFMQVCHGKAGPLRRLRDGDRVIYYSPEHRFRSKDRLQAFTALGHVRAGGPYQVSMSETFHPWRKDVDWKDTTDAPIRPLLNHLSFTQGKRNWGYQFRFGLFEIEDDDAGLIEASMVR